MKQIYEFVYIKDGIVLLQRWGSNPRHSGNEPDELPVALLCDAACGFHKRQAGLKEKCILCLKYTIISHPFHKEWLIKTKCNQKILSSWSIGRTRTSVLINLISVLPSNYDTLVCFVRHVRYHVIKGHACGLIFCFPFLLVPQTTLYLRTTQVSWRIVCYLTSHLTGWLLTIYSNA